MADKTTVVLDGSEHPQPRGQRLGRTSPDQRIQVTVYVRPNPRTKENLDDVNESIYEKKERDHLDHDSYVDQFGASAEDLESVHAFADSYGLEVLEASAAKRLVTVEGRARDLEAAFGVQLDDYRDSRQVAIYQSHKGAARIPSHLDGVVTAVLGLDNRPFATPHIRKGVAKPRAANSPASIAKRYKFPQGLDYSKSLVALIELGGGYNAADIATYFQNQGTTPPNMLTPIGTNGATNAPTGDPIGPDGEVALDIDVAGGVAPGIALLGAFGANTEQGFANIVLAATHYIWSETGKLPDALSISWGAPDCDWSTGGIRVMHQALQAASALGVAVTAASGDNGSTDGVNDGKQHVDLPASLEYATGAGGTSAMPNSEPVWMSGPIEGTGGGVATIFPVPGFQKVIPDLPVNVDTQKPGRCVPDVAASADPAYGYPVQVDGQTQVYGGTSAAAPLWAAAIAAINAVTGARMGNPNSMLYQWAASKSRATNPVTQGNNGAYSAKPGNLYNACCGVGTPNVEQLILSFRKVLGLKGKRPKGPSGPTGPARGGDTGLGF